MPYAVISDIHANWEALQAVLDDIRKQGITEIYCTGDIIGYGPDPSPCVNAVRKHCTGRTTKGNHELGLQILQQGGVLDMHEGPAEALRYSYRKLWQGQKKFLLQLPVRLTSGDAVFVHGNPAGGNPFLEINDYLLWKDNYVDYPGKITPLKSGLKKMQMHCFDESKARAVFDFMRENNARACITGHIHVAYCVPCKKDADRSSSLSILLANNPRLHKTPQEKTQYELKMEQDTLYIANTGAVGQPRDSDNRACYLIAGGDRLIWRRLPYDFETTIAKMKKRHLPEKHAERLRYGMYPDQGLQALLETLLE